MSGVSPPWGGAFPWAADPAGALQGWGGQAGRPEGHSLGLHQAVQDGRLLLRELVQPLLHLDGLPLCGLRGAGRGRPCGGHRGPPVGPCPRGRQGPTLSACTNSFSASRLSCCRSAELLRFLLSSTLSFRRSLSRSFRCRSMSFCSFFSWSILSMAESGDQGAAGGQVPRTGEQTRVSPQLTSHPTVLWAPPPQSRPSRARGEGQGPFWLLGFQNLSLPGSGRTQAQRPAGGDMTEEDTQVPGVSGHVGTLPLPTVPPPAQWLQVGNNRPSRQQVGLGPMSGQAGGSTAQGQGAPTTGQHPQGPRGWADLRGSRVRNQMGPKGPGCLSRWPRGGWRPGGMPAPPRHPGMWQSPRI